MIRLAAAAAVLLAAAPHDQPRVDGAHYAQVTIQQRIVIRVPSRPVGGTPASAPNLQWREGDGPRCLQADQIASANIRDQSVDFILRDNRRVRARLGRRCDGLHYYRGFYLDRPRDGRICAERDVIRSRMGGQCDIAAFRTLRPAAASQRPRP